MSVAFHKFRFLTHSSICREELAKKRETLLIRL